MSKKMEIRGFEFFRFGVCEDNTEGDFIDNMIPVHNIFVTCSFDENAQFYTVLETTRNFQVFEGIYGPDFIEAVAENLKGFLSEDIAKALYESASSGDSEGIIEYAPGHKDNFFKSRDDDDVDEFKPCLFAVYSITHSPEASFNLETGKVVMNETGEELENMSALYGCVNEDENYAVGIKITS